MNSNALNILVISKRTFPKEKACIIDMLCYLIYVKKFIVYNIASNTKVVSFMESQPIFTIEQILYMQGVKSFA